MAKHIGLTLAALLLASAAPPPVADTVIRGVPGPADPSYRTFGIGDLYRDVPTLTGMFEQRIDAWFEGRD